MRLILFCLLITMCLILFCLLIGYTGLGSLAHFSEDSGESSNQEDDYESEAGESEEHDDEYVYMDEQLERRTTTGWCLMTGLFSRISRLSVSADS